MVAQVRGVPPADYARWVADQKRMIDTANATAAREHRPSRPGGP
jgi:heme/copper-type cytochrome/quinol oxidase subunit 2